MDKKKLKETKKMVYKQSENINKETELIRRNQFLELKSTVTEMKNSFSLWFNRRPEDTEKGSINWRQLQLSSMRHRKKKEWIKMTEQRNLWKHHQMYKHTNYRIPSRKRKGQKRYLKKQWPRTSETWEDMNTRVQETQSNRI